MAAISSRRISHRVHLTSDNSNCRKPCRFLSVACTVPQNLGFCALGAQGRVFRNRDASRRIKSLSKEKTTRSGRAPLRFLRNKPSCSAGSPEPKAKIPCEPNSPHHLSHGDLACTRSHKYSFSIERTRPKSSNEFVSSPPKTKHWPARSRAVLGGR